MFSDVFINKESQKSKEKGTVGDSGKSTKLGKL